MVTVSKETAINNIVMDETLKPVGGSLKLIDSPVVSISLLKGKCHECKLYKAQAELVRLQSKYSVCCQPVNKIILICFGYLHITVTSRYYRRLK